MISNYFKEFISTRKAGFYIFCVGALLNVITLLAYWIGFPTDSALATYYNSSVPLILLVGTFVAVGLSLCNFTCEFASPVLWLVTLAAFCINIVSSYLYFTEVFFAGFSIESLFSIKVAYFIALLGPLTTLVLSFIGIIKKQRRAKDE